MIATPTTFIVGAGGSQPYGLPSGPAIAELARTLPSRAELTRLAERGGITEGDLERVLRDLIDDPAESIDEFLFRRQDDPTTQTVGRLLIAVYLGNAIRGQQKTWRATPPFRHDWLQVLLREMRAGASTLTDFIERNRGVRFVTFNFDSVIEDALYDHSRSAYRCSKEDGYKAVGQFDVIHVHGRLPHLDERPTKAWIQRAMSQISVVYDPPNPETGVRLLDAARQAVSSAEVLCFLGFSFDPRNIEKLAVRQTLNRNTGTEVYGSTLRLPAGERARAIDRLGLAGTPRLQFGSAEEDAADVLNKYHVIKG